VTKAAPPSRVAEGTSGCGPHHRPRVRFRLGGAGAPVCLWHAASHPAMLRVSVPTAAVVGTVLTLINQGSLLFDGQHPSDLGWKVPLTYSVPFMVSTWGALRVSRVRE